MQSRPNKEPEYESFTIPGTEITLPILMLHGKRYMEVAQRLVWFNYEKSDWILETEIELEDKDFIRFKAIVRNPEGQVMRMARKSKVIKDPKDYESCETGAIGRVLAFLGYGAQYASEDLSEGEDLADAPVPAGGVRNDRAKTNDRNIKPAGVHGSHSASSAKLKQEQASQHDAVTPFRDDELSFGPIDPVIGGLSKQTAESGVYTGKTFEEIFKHDMSKKFEWTKARMKETDSKKFPAWCAQYLHYAEIMGVRVE